MSLILEALRKSEEDDQTPVHRPVFSKTSPSQAKPLSSRRNIMAIFVILSGLLVLGILYKRSLAPSDYLQYGIGQSLPDGDANSLEFDSSTMKPLEKHPTSTPPLATKTNLSLPQIKPNKESGIVQPIAQSHAEEPIPAQTKKTEKIQNITRQVPTTSSNLQLLDTPNIDEVNPQIQKQLPKLRYESHWYDKQPNKRTVILNSLNLKEGDRFSHNLRVHSIAKDGCILSYNGFKFHMLMLQNWPEIDQTIY